MAHIGCLCGNDVRQNNLETVHYFVSDDLMDSEEETPFFGLPTIPGKRAEIWLCDECGRTIFFDDGRIHVTRIMRKTAPDGLNLPSGPSKAGVLYNDEIFFDAVDEFLTKEHEAGGAPDYEFFEARYADGKPLLTSSVMRELVFEDPDREFPRWSRALLAPDFLAELDAGGKVRRLWVLSEEDTARVTRPSRYGVACDVLRQHDLMGLQPGDPDGAPADEYALEARTIADALPADVNAEEVACVIAEVFTRKFGTRFTLDECAAAATDLVQKWGTLTS